MCPSINCDAHVSAVYKGYKSYYKKKRDGPQKSGQPRWHISAVQTHLLKFHRLNTDPRNESIVGQDTVDANASIVAHDTVDPNVSMVSHDTADPDAFTVQRETDDLTDSLTSPNLPVESKNAFRFQPRKRQLLTKHYYRAKHPKNQF